MRLIIGNQNIELGNRTKVAQTKQANDLINLNTRQTNYTNRFTVPLSAKNQKAMKYLGIVGNRSDMPYIRSDVYLYSDSGESFIYKGWATIKGLGDKGYKINVYDGNIDIYKAIENKDVSDADLSEISHTKNVTNVVNSWTTDLNYKYIVADYNGKALYDTDKINIDYLVPSVKVSYVWDKIFEYSGFTYSGSVFDTFEFKNLWMTYPKGVFSTVPEDIVYESNDMEFEVQNPSTIPVDPNPSLIYRQSTYLAQITNQTDELEQIQDNRHFKVSEAGNYRVEITGEIKPRGYSFYANLDPILQVPITCDLWLAKNSEDKQNSDDVVLLQLLQEDIGTIENFIDVGVIDVNAIVEIQENESLCFVLKNSVSFLYTFGYVEEEVDVELRISKVENEIIDFDNAFIGFKMKDFFSEILWRFGLTPYKDKYTNNYNFLTLQEVLQTDNVEDWSAQNTKFSSKKGETYVYSRYAQRNVLRHKYNDSEDDYYDGSILIDNENLQDTITVINSNIYVPEEEQTLVFEKPTNVYKLWNKEIKDDETVDYKSLSKRFYFMRYEDYNFSASQTVGSETLQVEQQVFSAPFESFFGLSFSDNIQDYYTPIYNILNQAKIITADIYLDEVDIVNLDLTKLYYIRELGGYHILNKVNNFIEKGLTSCELIKVDYTPAAGNGVSDIIQNIIVGAFDLATNKIKVFYDVSQMQGTSIDYIVNGGAPVTYPSNTGLIAFDFANNMPSLENTIYITDGITVSETKVFVS